MKNIKKTVKYTTFFLLCLFIQTNLYGGRSNPIMVIELDCGEFANELQRNEVNVREVIIFSCDDDQMGGCPPGYIEKYGDGCECVPDCAGILEISETCGGCDENDNPVKWIVTDSDQNSNDVGYCGCDPGEPYNCGCPSWLSEVNGDGGLYCDVLRNQPCYDGSLNIVQESVMVDCQNMNSEGLVTATVVIQLEENGACVSITQLQNCQLSGGEDFVLALSEQYEADAAFCAEADENTILLEFLFDPQGTIPMWAYLDNQGIEQFQPLLEPEDICSAAIPTLSTWTIIGLALILAISGLLFIKRKEVRKALHTMMLSF